ncbi:MAG: transposase [Phycisphaerales bacterium]|nr:transposase [Phycisphaerales bacterium]
MARTLGYHIVLSGYGLWLPGDQRGHWSDAWDAQIGFVEPHTLHAGDPMRRRMAVERMKHEPVRLTAPMIEVVIDTIGRCRATSEWSIAAASIEPTHTHLLLTFTQRDIDNTITWIKGRMTKAIHEQMPHHGPVWSRGKWRSYVFAQDVWANARRYIEQHNVRRGESAQPYPFIGD